MSSFYFLGEVGFFFLGGSCNFVFCFIKIIEVFEFKRIENTDRN